MHSHALELFCEGWFQNQGETIQKSTMNKVEQTNLNWKQSTKLNGYKYDVNWDINLDVIYATIAKDEKTILFTTARVPTFSHNDSFTDLNLPDGTRLSVSCSFK